MKHNNHTILNLLYSLYFRFVEFIGGCVFFGALSTVLALISYCAEDPSFNTAIDGFVSNFLSYPGSYYADIMIQCLGMSAYLVSVILLSFGYQLIRYHKVGFLRFVLGIVSVCCASTLSGLLNLKNGGLVGLLFSKSITKYSIWQQYNDLFLVIISIICIYTFLFAVRFRFSDCKRFCNFVVEQLRKYGSKKLTNLSTSSEHLIETKKDEKPKNSRKKNSFTKEHAESGFSLPSIQLLAEAKRNNDTLSSEDLQRRKEELLKVLKDFGIDGEIPKASPGPVVTLYELKPAAGIKSSRVIGLSSDIARYMSAVSARVAVIPGKNALGIELPNVKRQTVYLREVLESSSYGKTSAALPIALGKDIFGDPIVVDLAKTPHLLIAGTTGSGKSVGINAMILSLLYRLSPDECKFIMVDPKMLELSVYNDIPHLLIPVVTDPKKAVVALKWAVREMESRYKAMSRLGVRNIEGYNFKLNSLRSEGQEITKKIQTGFDPETGAPKYEDQILKMEPIPYIVIVVDEMADLMLVAGKDIESAVQRLAQMARAAGIHLIMATQRPSADVITGVIKANFPTRISFQVSSKIDSRVILGDSGAEQLLGQGDMLYMASGGRTIRVHCPFVSDSEVEKVTEALREQGEPHYVTDVLEENSEFNENNDGTGSNGDDPMYKEAVDLILREGKASTSFLQRHLKIGYNRAARIIDMMEAAGIVSAANHVGKREILSR
ncbi:MAG: cell division protein FtsK [Alphaproteobacteria bacterium]|nr:cell division protein FtsK [Alphaproteobacteria bacterium]